MGGVQSLEVPVMGGVQLWEVSSYVRCPIMPGARLCEVPSYGRHPVMGGV